MLIELISKKVNKLSKTEILQICKLKEEQWKYGIKSQIDYFNKIIKKNDIHNLFFINSKLVGYTLLRKRSCLINKIKAKYLFLDTLIIKKNFRGQNKSKLIMNFNNEIIKKHKMISFLLCKKNLLNFYEKFHWINIKNSNISILDHSFSDNGMIFNYQNLKNNLTKFSFYINK